MCLPFFTGLLKERKREIERIYWGSIIQTTLLLLLLLLNITMGHLPTFSFNSVVYFRIHTFSLTSQVTVHIHSSNPNIKKEEKKKKNQEINVFFHLKHTPRNPNLSPVDLFKAVICSSLLLPPSPLPPLLWGTNTFSLRRWKEPGAELNLNLLFLRLQTVHTCACMCIQIHTALWKHSVGLRVTSAPIKIYKELQ